MNCAICLLRRWESALLIQLSLTQQQQTVQVPSLLSHWPCLPCACTAIVIPVCGTKMRSTALLGLELAAGLWCYQLRLHCTLQTCGSQHQPFQHSICCLPPAPAQLLQVSLAVITSHLGCILFLISVTQGFSSCQLVAPLSLKKEATPGQDSEQFHYSVSYYSLFCQFFLVIAVLFLSVSEWKIRTVF